MTRKSHLDKTRKLLQHQNNLVTLSSNKAEHNQHTVSKKNKSLHENKLKKKVVNQDTEK